MKIKEFVKLSDALLFVAEHQGPHVANGAKRCPYKVTSASLLRQESP